MDIVRFEDLEQIPVNVVGANISYAVLDDIEVSIGLSHGDPSMSTHQREQQLAHVFFLYVCVYSYITIISDVYVCVYSYITIISDVYVCVYSYIITTIIGYL